MNACLASLVLAAAAPSGEEPAYYAVSLEELSIAPGFVLPQYGGAPPWQYWGAEPAEMPWAVLDVPGEAVFVPDASHGFESLSAQGGLVVRADGPGEVDGRLFLPKSSGEGFLVLPFRVPPAARASESDFLRAEALRYGQLVSAGVPGGAWFRHESDRIAARLETTSTGPVFRPQFRDSADALSLFSGSRALSENLQLERGLPPSDGGEETVALETLTGVTVRGFDWKPLLAAGETELDALAALVPADQHALFFPSFQAFADVLDEAARLGELGLVAFEDRSTDAGTRARLERQLLFALDAAARELGPKVVQSVAITGSDPYLRSGSDVALLLETRDPGALGALLLPRYAAAEAEEARIEGALAGAVSETRAISSYLAEVGGALVVTNSPEQLARIRAAGAEALSGSDEYRYFRQRYRRGGTDESALLVLPDAAIRRWCSPRWRIAAARRVRAAAELAEEHAQHLEELLSGKAADRELGPDPDFPALGALRMADGLVHSPLHGNLDFLTPIAELPLERVSQREADLYRTWREGYEHNWSNFFDPIGARLALDGRRVALDLTVMPLILGTRYDELRKLTRGPGLPAGGGDLHAESLIHFAMSFDREWEELKSVGMSLGSAAQALGADPLGWLGDWFAVYLDDAPFWDELLDAENLEEAFERFQDDPSGIPLAVTIAVSNPLKLTVFLSALRTFADETAPGMAVWTPRVVGERRFVEISSPGLGPDEFKLLYATHPQALVLSLNEATLLRALERAERRAAGEAQDTALLQGAHAHLELRGRGVELLEGLLGEGVGSELRRDCWRNLPILNEWKRLHPEADPVALHERVFRERLECPAGGTYAWNAEWATMESSVHGHPGEPRGSSKLPAAWEAFAALRSNLTFENDGLRVRVELERE